MLCYAMPCFALLICKGHAKVIETFVRAMGEARLLGSLPISQLRFGIVFLFSYFVNIYAAPFPLAGFHGDPHFHGADGINFDFTGEPGHSYCLLTDTEFHVNMLMGTDGGAVSGSDLASQGIIHTWVKGLGFLTLNHTIEMHAKYGDIQLAGEALIDRVLVDGAEVELDRKHMFQSGDGLVRLASVYTAGVSGGEGEDGLAGRNGLAEIFMLTLYGNVEGNRRALKMKITIREEETERRVQEDSKIHFSVEILEAPVFDSPHGVMGQTFRLDQKKREFGFRTGYNSELSLWQVAGGNGEGYLDGEMDDYRTAGILDSDCRYSTFRYNRHGQSIGTGTSVQVQRSHVFPASRRSRRSLLSS